MRRGKRKGGKEGGGKERRRAKGGGNYEKVRLTHRDLDHTYRKLSLARATLF